jgi:hypothetical protein
MPESIRPVEKTPDTGQKTDRRQLDAEVAHESTLRDFAIHHTELSCLDKDQMGVISLVRAGESLGLYMPATMTFFENIRLLSPAEEGKGRVQAKECITAGAFPMSLLYGEQKTSWFDTIKSLVTRKPTESTPAQKGM